MPSSRRRSNADVTIERDRAQKSEAHQKLRASDTPARLKTLATPTLVFFADDAISTPGVASASIGCVDRQARTTAASGTGYAPANVTLRTDQVR